MCLCSVILTNVEHSEEISAWSPIDLIHYWGLVLLEWVDGVWIWELIQGSIHQPVTGRTVQRLHGLCITKIEHSLRDGNTCAFKFVHLYDYMYLAVSILLIPQKTI